MPKIVVRVHTAENTSKAFGVDDETIADLHKLMKEKVEISEAEGRKWGIVDKRMGDERFAEGNEKVQSIVSAWEKDKKKTKGGENDYQFWWKQKPTENRTIRVYFLDGTFKAVVVNSDTSAGQLHDMVVQKIELTRDASFGLFDQRKKSERPLPPSENIFTIMEDWKKTAKKGDKEEDTRFVFRLKHAVKDEDVVDDPVRVHLLYLEAKSELMNGALIPNGEDMVSLAALEMQVNFGDHTPSTHKDGFLGNKLKEIIPKKILSSKKESQWEKEIFKQHASHKGMRPLFAKLEYLQILNPNFKASASIVAINKAEQSKREEEELVKKAQAAKAKPAAPTSPQASGTSGVPVPTTPPAAPSSPQAKEEDVHAFPTRDELTATAPPARVATRFDLLSSIEEGVNLKKAEEISDRSAPKIENVKIKKVNRDGLLKGVEGGVELKKTETVDKSSPQTAGVKIKKVDRKSMLDNIEKGEAKLKHAETVDKSGPKIAKQKANPNAVVGEIASGDRKLKKAQTTDKSSPVIDKQTKVKKIDRKGLLQGIETKETKLKHADTVDKSAPVLEGITKVDVGGRQNLLASIEEGYLLHHVTEGDQIPKGEGPINKPKGPKAPKPPGLKGPSAKGAASRPPPPHGKGGVPKPPKPPGSKAGGPPPPPPPPETASGGARTEVFASIEKGEARLKKTETVDKSGPKVEGQVKIKKVDRKDLLKGIEDGAELKKAETVDKSGPVVEGVKVKKVDRKGMLDSIQKGDAKLKHSDTADKSAPKISKKKVDPNAVLSAIPGEKKLKKSETQDKSAPVIERVKVKKVDRQGLMRGIEAGVDLKHVDDEEQKDASAPVISGDVHVKKEETRPALLKDIEKGTKLKKAEDTPPATEKK